MPKETPVAIVDLRGGAPGFEVDHGGAQRRIERLTTLSSSVRLAEGIEAALDRLLEKQDHRKEIYLLTDLAAVEFEDHVLAKLGRRLEAAPDVSLYIVDVGVDQPNNIALGELAISGEVVALGSSFDVTTELWRENNSTPVTVDLLVSDLRGNTVKRRQLIDGSLQYLGRLRWWRLWSFFKGRQRSLP